MTRLGQAVKHDPAGFLAPHVVQQGMTAEFLPMGDIAVRVVFGAEISPPINEQVHRFCHHLQAEPIRGVIEWVSSYASVTVYYQPWTIGYDELCGMLVEHGAEKRDIPLSEAWAVEIPVCYGGKYGPDLDEVATLHGLDGAQVIERHAGGDYLIYFLGFLPGFPYLGGLDPLLATPRRATPRLRVPAGAVGIAGAQTGIYPLETPGGWQIIGRTPLRLYDPDRQPPALLAAGNHVRFVPITATQFEEAANGPH